LSLPQQRLWFLNRFSPESSAYNIAFVIRIDGDLDVTALRAALTDLVERHEVFAHRLPRGQLRRPAGGAADRQGDARDRAGIDDEESAERLLRGSARTGFDLTKAVPLRITVCAPASNTICSAS